MSTISLPASVHSWPRAALAAVVALIVALAITISLALTVGRHSTTRTVFKQVDQPLSCTFGRPC